MSLPRLLFLLLLLLLLLLLAAAGCCHAAPRHRGSGGRAEGRGAARSQRATEHGEKAPKRTGRSDHESSLRDPKHKERFITHLTGPLYFKPRCRRQFHRLYRNTRDCTVPAYYKRCARLLTQLAKSPHCAER